MPSLSVAVTVTSYEVFVSKSAAVRSLSDRVLLIGNVSKGISRILNNDASVPPVIE